MNGRGKRELVAAGLFALLSSAVPVWHVELFPFSRAPMFADAPVCYCDYAVYDLEGRPLEPLDFGLQRNYWGNPLGVGVGFHPPASVDQFGTVPDRAAVTATVEKHLANFPYPEGVDVVRTVIGPVEGGRVGVVSHDRWRITRSRPVLSQLP